jgi:hypothetical protein
MRIGIVTLSWVERQGNLPIHTAEQHPEVVAQGCTQTENLLATLQAHIQRMFTRLHIGIN